MKKKQSSKKHKTYRPKFAKLFSRRKKKVREEEEGLLQNPEQKREKYKVSMGELPEQYNPVGQEAYRFPSYIYVFIVLGVFALLIYLFY